MNEYNIFVFINRKLNLKYKMFKKSKMYLCYVYMGNDAQRKVKINTMVIVV